MVRKRLVGVITVKGGWAVQSFGYARHLPLGRPEVIAWNLDRWGVDEILVVAIDRSNHGLGPDFDTLKRVVGLGLATPLAYGGGIHTVEHAATVIQSGAERVCVDAALHGSGTTIRKIAELVGGQALIGALPLCMDGGAVGWYDYHHRRTLPLSEEVARLFGEGTISEALVIDVRHEGHKNAFDLELVRQFPLPDVALIAFGGISEAAQLQHLFGLARVSAVGVGNSLSYREHAVQGLKEHLGALPLRPPVYASSL